MKMLIKVSNFIILTFMVVSSQKNNDESRPYEFGFTIDGQQHRHEKKDVNGIIQGEFGFITADGIYHVTVYATDENGNFKILSMRNIRISAPLDGSPLPPGAKIEGNPQQANLGLTSPQTQAQKQQQNSQQAQSQPQNLPQVQRQPLNLPQAQIQRQPQTQLGPVVQTTTRPRTTFAFTTQPTIKPACGGCGYVTTPKPRPGQLFPFQIPAFQKPSQQNPAFGSSPNKGIPAQTGTTFPSRGGASLSNPGSQNTGFGSNGNAYPGQGGTDLSNLTPELGHSSVGGFSPSNSGSNYPNPGSTYPNQGSRNPGFNEIDGTNGQRKPLSQVTVSNGAIHVPGNPDIPIRDKFPGMVDGLPDGIREKDITDLLYKFNYTVGFHGHYEKGLKNGAKVGGYFVTGRDGISRIVTYVADENGFRPKVKFIRLDLNSDEVPKEGTEKKFGLKNFEFVWYPIS